MKHLAFDTLSDGALAVAMELRRGGFTLIAYKNRRTRELFITPSDQVTPELLARIQEHVGELVELIYGQGQDGKPGGRGRPKAADRPVGGNSRAGTGTTG